MVDLPSPRHVRHVDHAVNVVLDLDEGAVGCHVAHLAPDFRSLGELLGNQFPRVLHRLPESKRDLPRILLDVKHHRFHFVADLKDVTRAIHLLGPRHLRDMDQSLHTFLKLNESAVRHDVHDAALHRRVHGEFNIDGVPGIAFLLFQAE